MLFGILMFLLLCGIVSLVGSLNLVGWAVGLIAWIGSLPVFLGIAVCVAPFILAYVLSKFIKASKKK